MIFEHRIRYKHQNADSLSKKTEFYERQEQREATDRKSKMASHLWTRRRMTVFHSRGGLTIQKKPIDDHLELPAEHDTKKFLERKTGMLKSKIVREKLKAKSYDLGEVKTRTVTIGEDLRRLLEKLAGDKPIVWNIDKDKPEVTILKRRETAHGEDSTIGKQLDDKEVVRTLVEKIPEDILIRTKSRKKKVTFKKEAEHLGPDEESGEWSKSKGDSEEENLSGESEEWEDDSEKSGDDQDSLCKILAEEKMRHHDRELQTDSSAGTYNLEQQDAYGGEELEKIVVSR